MSKSITVWPSCMLEEGDDLWIFHGKLNLLLVYNTKSDKISVKGCLPDNKTIFEYNIGSMCMNNDYVFLFPLRGKRIYRYDIHNDLFEEIKYPHVVDDIALFGGAAIYNNDIYIMPIQYPFILKICGNDLYAQIAIDYSAFCKSIGIEFNDSSFLSRPIEYNNSLVSIIEGTNVIIEFDMMREKLASHKVKNKQHCIDLVSDGDRIAIGTYNKNEVIILDKGFQICKNVTIYDQDTFLLEDWGRCFAVVSEYEGDMSVYDYEGNLVIRRKPNKRDVCDCIKYSYGYGLGYRGHNNSYYYDRTEYKLLILSNPIKEVVLNVFADDICISQVEPIIENEYLDLNWFIDKSMDS